MDFKAVLSRLLTAFREQDIRYALMGGFAMGLWGGSRSTVDLDFLVVREDMPKVGKIMKDMGYELRHHSENVTQYCSPLERFGGIDFIHAFRDASLGMLERAAEKEIFGGALKIKTLIPEDIIGLKLQSIYNDPAREKTDLTDIETLVSICGSAMDRALLRRYFSLFEMDALYKSLLGDEE